MWRDEAAIPISYLILNPRREPYGALSVVFPTAFMTNWLERIQAKLRGVLAQQSRSLVPKAANSRIRKKGEMPMCFRPAAIEAERTCLKCGAKCGPTDEACPSCGEKLEGDASPYFVPGATGSGMPAAPPAPGAPAMPPMPKAPGK